MKRNKLMMIGAAGVALAAVLGPLAARALATPPDVPTEKVKRETLSVTVFVSGKTEPSGAKDVFPPVQGTIKRILVTEGQQVVAGQKLAEMDPAPLNTQLLAAEAAYRAAQAQADAIDDQGPSSADYEAANVSASVARRAYDRASEAMRRLESTGPHAAAEIAAAEAARDQAHAAHLQARSAKRKLATAEPTGSQRTAAAAALAQAKDALTLAKSYRAKATLKAPIAGVVTFNSPVPSPTGEGKPTDGCSVSPASAPFTIAPAARFTGQADEVDVARIQPGDPAVVRLDAFPGVDFRTEVGSIKPQAVQTKTGGTAFPVLIPLDDVDESIRLGMNGNVEIAVDAVEDALTVPAEALVDEGDASFVFVLENGRLSRTPVETGAMTDTRIQIVRGLSEGDVVAIPANGETLTDGMSVKAGR